MAKKETKEIVKQAEKAQHQSYSNYGVAPMMYEKRFCIDTKTRDPRQKPLEEIFGRK